VLQNSVRDSSGTGCGLTMLAGLAGGFSDGESAFGLSSGSMGRRVSSFTPVRSLAALCTGETMMSAAGSALASRACA
jgi:hypothetical protein